MSTRREAREWAVQMLFQLGAVGACQVIRLGAGLLEALAQLGLDGCQHVPTGQLGADVAQ